MNDEVQELEGLIGTNEAMEPHIEMILKENHVLKTWVTGILQGCEGCIGEATQWAGSMGALMVHGEEEEKIRGEFNGEVEVEGES